MVCFCAFLNLSCPRRCVKSAFLLPVLFWQSPVGVRNVLFCPPQKRHVSRVSAVSSCSPLVFSVCVFPCSSSCRTLCARICVFISCLLHKDHDGSQSWSSFLNWFLYISPGTIRIYSVYQPDYNKNTKDPDHYCDKTLYLFAFWTTNLAFVLLAVLFFSYSLAVYFLIESDDSEAQTLLGDNQNNAMFIVNFFQR